MAKYAQEASGGQFLHTDYVVLLDRPCGASLLRAIEQETCTSKRLECILRNISCKEDDYREGPEFRAATVSTESRFRFLLFLSDVFQYKVARVSGDQLMTM
ncbi:hypothetical protein EJB05_01826 [Eragrostis curvula]|uniref:Uncharacterized protein n=1 Tax=Eragrostis curvula TaxID=38414 RepID=A0A5J9WT45_9POAL|nr:hypothetical protein EJB05_01826 [Eragrostis curvula]